MCGIHFSNVGISFFSDERYDNFYVRRNIIVFFRQSKLLSKIKEVPKKIYWVLSIRTSSISLTNNLLIWVISYNYNFKDVKYFLI